MRVGRERLSPSATEDAGGIAVEEDSADSDRRVSLSVYSFLMHIYIHISFPLSLFLSSFLPSFLPSFLSFSLSLSLSSFSFF